MHVPNMAKAAFLFGVCAGVVWGVFGPGFADHGPPYFDPLMPKTLFQVIFLVVYAPGILGSHIAGWPVFSALAIDFGMVSILVGTFLACSLVSVGWSAQWLVHGVIAQCVGTRKDALS